MLTALGYTVVWIVATLFGWVLRNTVDLYLVRHCPKCDQEWRDIDLQQAA